MNSYIAFGLIWINIIVAGTTLYFSLNINPNQNNYYNYYNNTKKYNEESKITIRHLGEEELKLNILFVDIASIGLVIFLVISFTYEKDKCCLCCDQECLNKCADFKMDSSSNSGGDNCAGVICIILLTMVILILWTKTI